MVPVERMWLLLSVCYTNCAVWPIRRWLTMQTGGTHSNHRVT